MAWWGCATHRRQRTLPPMDRLCGHGFPSHHTSCKTAFALPDGPKLSAPFPSPWLGSNSKASRRDTRNRGMLAYFAREVPSHAVMVPGLDPGFTRHHVSTAMLPHAG